MSTTLIDPLLGKRVLNFFRLRQKIGAGAFAAVYLAEQEGTERVAVVKVAHPHLASDKTTREQVFARFAAEFKASTRVNHPNIATIYTAGRTDENLPAIAMEYVPGLTLSALLPQHAPLSLEATPLFVEQIGGALLSLHRAGIIHRDITPNNIVVYRDTYTQKPVYKLLDFGIAKVDDANGQTSGPIGTPRYMAPEQVHGQVHEKTDIYGLGALLWWFITGQEYLGHIKKISELFLYHLKPNVVPSPATLRPGLPIMLVQLLRSMLHSEPAQRPSLEAILDKWPKLIGSRANNTMWPWGDSQRELPVMAALPPEPPRKLRSYFLSWGLNPVSSTVLSCGIKEFGFDAKIAATPEELISLLATEWDVVVASSEILHDTILFSKLRQQLKEERKLYLISESPQETQKRIEGRPFIEVIAPEKIPHLCFDIAQGHGLKTTKVKSSSKSDGSFTDSNSEMSPDSQIEIIEHFIGMMPEWLAELEESISNEESARAMCRQVYLASSSVGADHMARLASILSEMLKVQMYEDAAGVLEEMSKEYSELFRKLLSIRTSCIQKRQALSAPGGSDLH